MLKAPHLASINHRTVLKQDPAPAVLDNSISSIAQVKKEMVGIHVAKETRFLSF